MSSNEKKYLIQRQRKYLIAFFVITNLIMSVVGISIYLQRVQTATTTIEKSNPKFIISSWSYPDEYGQGIDFINVYENSTGSWVLVTHPIYGNNIDPDETNPVFDWNASIAIKFRCGVVLNATLTGVSSVAEGKNYLRLSVVVTQSNGTIVFSQQNFTYVSGNDFGLYWYDYDCVLNFLPVVGVTYTATITYEVLYF